MTTKYRSLLVLSLTLFLGACGGGGADNNAASGNTAQTGTVGILLTDAPGTDYDQALATITGISLICDPWNVVIFQGRKVVDLLQLTDFYEFFAVADDVPANRQCSKIRLQVESLVLIKFDDQGNELERVLAVLPGNGKLDLNNQGPFSVPPGGVLIVKIDWDMNKAFKTITTGNGKVIVRPVIFVDIVSDVARDRMARIFGRIDQIDAASTSFKLCRTELESTPIGSRTGDDTLSSKYCVRVIVDSKTGLFDENGEPIRFANLMVDDMVTAVGLFRVLDDDTCDDDVCVTPFDDRQYFALDAVVVERGPQGTFRRWAGMSNTVVDASNQFEFEFAPGQGFAAGSTVATQLFANTRIFSRRGVELDSTAIDAGVHMRVDGVLHSSNTNPGLLNAALLLLNLNATFEDILRGSVLSVDTATNSLRLTNMSGDRCVNANNAKIFIVETANVFISNPAMLRDLMKGQRIDVFGTDNAGGCFDATTIIADAELP